MANNNKILKSNIFQRTVYLIILVALLFKFYMDERYVQLMDRSYIGLPYIILYIIPISILIIQVLKNTYLGWFAFILMYLFVSIFIILEIIRDFELSYRNSSIADYLISLILIIIILLSLLLMIKIKPDKQFMKKPSMPTSPK